jgi:hypothetical protein
MQNKSRINKKTSSKQDEVSQQYKSFKYGLFIRFKPLFWPIGLRHSLQIQSPKFRW